MSLNTSAAPLAREFIATSALSGALWVIAGVAAFEGAGALVKFLGQSLSSFELAFLRAAFGLPLVLLLWKDLRGIRHLRDPWIHLLRNVLGVVVLFSMAYAYTTLPLALVITVFCGRIFMIIPLARVFLGERIPWTAWIASATGFAGIIVSLLPKFGATGATLIGALAALVAALCSASSQVSVRRLTDTNPPSTIMAVFTVFCVFATAPAAWWNWQTPQPAAWPWLVIMGLLAAVSQIFLAKGYRIIGASLSSPLSLLQLPISTFLGFVLFREVPDAYGLAGAFLVLASALHVTVACTRLARC